jgi:hypothetical protein
MEAMMHAGVIEERGPAPDEVAVACDSAISISQSHRPDPDFAVFRWRVTDRAG